MRDFMYSEISAVNDIANVPECTELAIKAGKGLCENLLEPLRDISGTSRFGRPTAAPR